MSICVLGKNLTALMLSKILVNKGLNVDILFKREMVTKAYVPKLLNAHLKNGKKVKAITFTVDKNHKNYFREKCYYKKIELISKASGFLGSCKEYLKNTAKSLEEINISDKEITNLMKIL